jgi:MerR family transcriptional regulator, light-induced transcriptional regulator
VNGVAAELGLHQYALARRSTELVYERMPELAEAYGPEGRRRCEEDAVFHVRFLLAAVAIDDATVFRDHAVWTRELLARYGIPASHLAAAFGALEQAVVELLPGAAEAARTYLRAGEDALDL